MCIFYNRERYICRCVRVRLYENVNVRVFVYLFLNSCFSVYIHMSVLVFFCQCCILNSVDIYSFERVRVCFSGISFDALACKLNLIDDNGTLAAKNQMADVVCPDVVKRTTYQRFQPNVLQPHCVVNSFNLRQKQQRSLFGVLKPIARQH